MMQSTDDRAGLNASSWLDGAPVWGVFAERKMRAHCVIVVHVTGEHMSQVMFAKHDHMVEAFPADRAD